MTTTRGGKYEWSVICEVCGFKKKAEQLRQRWDGKMVCQQDWEPRNILDFYRTRQDAHRLPFTRPDNQSETTWTPTLGSIAGTFTKDFSYHFDSDTLKFVFTGLLTPTGTCISPNESINMPSVLLTAGHTIHTVSGGTVIGKNTGKLYCSDFQNNGGNILMNGTFSFTEPIIIKGTVITN